MGQMTIQVHSYAPVDYTENWINQWEKNRCGSKPMSSFPLEFFYSAHNGLWSVPPWVKEKKRENESLSVQSEEKYCVNSLFIDKNYTIHFFLIYILLKSV